MRALMTPTMIGSAIGTSAGSSMLRSADFVTMSIARPYSGRDVPSMIPGFSRNWRRTSSTTSPPTRPTACIASDAKRNGIRPPMKRPAITHAFDRSNVSVRECRARLRLLVDPVGVRAEEDERGERGGADRVALRDGLRRVADGVERIGDRANLRRQVRHLGDAARVVGHRAVRVERDDEAGHRELRHDRDADAEEAGDVVRDEDAGRDDDHRQRRRLHADREPFDDVRRVARLRALARSPSPGSSGVPV